MIIGMLPAPRGLGGFTTSAAASGTAGDETTIWSASGAAVTLPLNPANGTEREVMNIHATAALQVAAAGGDTLVDSLTGYVLPGKSARFIFLASTRTWYRMGRMSYSHPGPFHLANIAANLTDSLTLVRGNGGASTCRSWTAVRAALLTGISGRFITVTGSLGTATFSIFRGVNGAAAADVGASYDVVFTPAGADNSFRAVFSTPLLLAANDHIEVAITTTSAWNSTTADVAVDLEVVE